MRKLQVHTPQGWQWVFCRKMPGGQLQTCYDKRKALPDRAWNAADDLAWARKTWPQYEFRLADSLLKGE